MKLLLYCNKNKPYLYKLIDKYSISQSFMEDALNGKIVAECDYEISEIEFKQAFYFNCPLYITKAKEPFKYFSYIDLLKASGFQDNEIRKYLGNKNGKAIHIKNLKIFDEPKKLSEYFTDKPYKDINKIFTDEIKIKDKWYRPLTKAPQNMCYVYDKQGNKYALISIRPEWLCKILNGEKTIEVRKKVLKEMEK